MIRRSPSFWSRDPESVTIFASVLILNLIAVWFVVDRLQLLPGDALARTYLAWRVLLGEEKKLANIGFVWTPLPSILQLPLVLLPPLRFHALSGNLITAVAGAGNVVVLHALARQWGWSSIAR